MPATNPPSRRRSAVGNWFAHLAREWTVESWRPIKPASARPDPKSWSAENLTAAWLGHATVLINFFGLTILTDPVLFPRCGIHLPGLTIGPKRLTSPALRVSELPPIDLVLLSHAHFDHFDLRTLHRLPKQSDLITAPRTSDLLRFTFFRNKRELRWGETFEVRRDAGAICVTAFPVKHWGARLRTKRDNRRGYNGYILKGRGRRIIFGGDTALTDSFAALHSGKPFDLAIMPIGAYDPWIRSHATPEQAVAMANAAGAEHVMGVHHQTFRLSFEPFREPIERFQAALNRSPDRIALREIGETFHLPA